MSKYSLYYLKYFKVKLLRLVKLLGLALNNNLRMDMTCVFTEELIHSLFFFKVGLTDYEFLMNEILIVKSINIIVNRTIQNNIQNQIPIPNLCQIDSNKLQQIQRPIISLS